MFDDRIWGLLVVIRKNFLSWIKINTYCHILNINYYYDNEENEDENDKWNLPLRTLTTI